MPRENNMTCEICKKEANGQGRRRFCYECSAMVRKEYLRLNSLNYKLAVKNIRRAYEQK